jgi:hypothetical protein
MIAEFKIHTTKSGKRYYQAGIVGYGTNVENLNASRAEIFTLMSHWLQAVSMAVECNRMDYRKESRVNGCNPIR